MANANRHIIEKQFIDIEMQGNADAFIFKDEVIDICKSKLLPEIERIFDEGFKGDKIFRFDKIEIDAGNISGENWESEFVEKVIVNLSEYIETNSQGRDIGIGREDSKIVSKERNNSGTILFFLEKGYLPWYSDIKQAKEIRSVIEELVIYKADSFIIELKDLLTNNKAALKRLVNQFDSDTLELLFKKLFSDTSPESITKVWGNLLKEINLSNSRIKEIIYRALFDTKQIMRTDSSILQDTTDNILKLLSRKDVSGLSGAIDQTDVEINKKILDDETEELYISNSGLVIIHPFLLKLFEKNGYIENKEWIGTEQQQRAIALLQYAATGLEEYPEFLLMLNKIICGYEISESLLSDIRLSEFEKNEADELLTSVIGHWTALKNTTVNGLRETFLMRNGKLSHDSNGWLLQVEVKTVDILINKLPWGMSMVKLPWMKEMLKVEWSY